jgi:hypothetical protein
VTETVADRQNNALERWRERLRSVRIPRLASDVDVAALGGEQVAPKRLLQHARREPGFALELLRLANARLRADDLPRGVEHALKLAGQSQLRTLLRMPGAPRFDARAPGHLGCLQAMATTRLASLYLQGWLRHTLASDEDSRLAVLQVLDVVRWKLPLLEPELATEIEARVFNGERRARVESELLDCDPQLLAQLHLQDLGFAEVPAHASSLQLPPRLWAQAVFCGRRGNEETTPDPEPTLALALRERLLGCSLAQQLALSTQVDWYSRRTADLVAAAATWLGRPRSQILRGLQRQAVYASGELVFTQRLRAPAVGLLWPPRPPRTMGAQAAKAGDAAHGPLSVAATARRPEPALPEDPVARCLLRCEQQAHVDVPALLAEVLRAFRQLGLQRCALFLRQSGSARLGSYFSSGFEPALAPRGLAFEPGAVGLLPRLLAQPGNAFWLQPAMLAGIASKLPAPLAAWPMAGGFALAAVASSGHAFGFWWVDSAARGGLDADSFAAFRRLAQAFGPEFARLLKLQRAQLASRATSD